MKENNFWFRNMENYVMVPKDLIENPRYRGLTGDEMLIYSLMVERMNLSAKNEEFYYSNGGVFIYYPIREIMRVLGCSERKAARILRKLTDTGLIIRAYQGQGKPAKIVPLRYRKAAETGSVIQ